jgi:acyl dehydratase
LRGLLFDDFQLGQTFVSQGRTVTEADIVAFAGLSGDFNPLHVDEEFARSTTFRQRIAHGLLVQAISSGLASQMGVFEGTIVALKGMNLDFRAPVGIGDTIHIELGVLELDPSPTPKRGWVRLSATVLNQNGDVVIAGSWMTVMHRKRPARRPAART